MRKPRTYRSLTSKTTKALLPAAALALATAPSHAIVWTGNHPSSPDWQAFQIIGGIPRMTNWAGPPIAPPVNQPLQFGDQFAGGGFSSGIPELNVDWSALSLTIDHTGGRTIFTSPANTLLLTTGALNRATTSTGNHTITSNIGLGAPATWDINGTNYLQIDGDITGPTSLTKVGTATLRFIGSDDNTYTGTTTVTEGKLTLTKDSNTNAIPADLLIDGTGLVQNPGANNEQIINSATVTVDAAGARYDLNGATETVNTVTTNAGITELGGGTLKTTTYNANGGITRLQGGTLDTNTFNANGGTINLNGGTLDTLTLLGNTNINMGTDGSIIANTGAYSGSFSGSGNTTLTKNGAGTLTLPGTNVLASIEINDGNLNIASGGTLEADTGGITMTGGTLTRDSTSSIVIPSGQALDATAGGSLDYTGATSIGSGITYNLGNGIFRHEGTLTLDGGTVSHTGWLNGVGVDGTGNNGSDLIINSGLFINTSAISLTGGDGGSGASINDGGDSGSITVNGGSFSSSTNFVMRGGSPTTFSGVGGDGGSGGNFTVNGGTATLASSVLVELHGHDGNNSSAAGIDGGAGGDGGDISVTGGTLTINVTAPDGLYMAGGVGGTSSGGGVAGVNGQDGSVSVSGGTLNLEAGLFTNSFSPPAIVDPIIFHNIPLNVSGTGTARATDDMTIEDATVTITSGALLDASGIDGNFSIVTPGNTITLTGSSANLDAQAGSEVRIRGGNTTTGQFGGENGGALVVNNGTFTLDPTATLNLIGGLGGSNGGGGGMGGNLTVANATATLDGAADLSGANGSNRIGGSGSGGNGGNAGSLTITGGNTTLANTLAMIGGAGAVDNGGIGTDDGGNGGDGGNVTISGGNLTLNTGAIIDMTPGTGGLGADSNGNPGTPGAIAVSGSGTLTLNAGIITSDNSSPTPTDPIHIENTTIDLTTGGTLNLHDDATIDNATINADASTVTFDIPNAFFATDGYTLTIQNGSNFNATSTTNINFDGGRTTSSTGTSGDGGTLNLTGGTLNIGSDAIMTLNAGPFGNGRDSGRGGEINISGGTANLDGGVQVNGRNASGVGGLPDDGGNAGQVTVSGSGILNQAATGTLQIRAGRADSSAGLIGATGLPGFFQVDGGTADFAGTLDLSGNDGVSNFLRPTPGSDSGDLILLAGSATLSGTANMTGGDGGKSSTSSLGAASGGSGGLVDIQGGTLTLDGATALIDLSPGTGGASSPDGSPGAVAITGGKLELIEGTITTDTTATPSADPINIIQTNITATTPGTIRIKGDTTFQGGTVTLNDTDLNADGTIDTSPTRGNNITLDAGATLDALGTSNVTLIGEDDSDESKIGGDLTVTDGSFNLGPDATLSTLGGSPSAGETTKAPGNASFAAGASALQGTLSMHGRKGADYNDGIFTGSSAKTGATGATFTVLGTADVNLSGTLNLYGGNGGDGITIATDVFLGSGRDGTNGAAGAAGGDIDVQGGTLTIDGATADLTGGNGGNGPGGTDDGKGGNGGNGGDGGVLHVAAGTVNIQGASLLDLSAGDPDNGGGGGSSGNGGNGGSGGNGGQLNISGGTVTLTGASTIDLSRTLGMPGRTGGGSTGADGSDGTLGIVSVTTGGTLTIDSGTISGNNPADATTSALADPILIENTTVDVLGSTLDLNDDTTLDNVTLNRDATGNVDLAIDTTLTAQNSSTLNYTGNTTIPVTRTYALTTASTFNHAGNLTLTDGHLTLDASTLNASGGTGTNAETTPGHNITLNNHEAFLGAQNTSQITLAGGNVTSGSNGKDGGSIIISNGAQLTLDGTSTLDISGGTGPDNGGHAGNGGTLTIDAGFLTLAGATNLSGPNGNNLTTGNEFLGGGNAGNAGTLNINGGSATLSNTLTMTGGNGGNDKQNPVEPDTGGNGGNGGNINVNGGSLTLNAGTSIDLTPGLGALAMGLDGFETDGTDGTPGAINVAGGTLTLNAGLATADNTLTPIGDTTEFNALIINLSVGVIDASSTTTGLHHGAALNITGGSATFDTLNMSGQNTAITGSGGTLTINTQLNATADAIGGLTIDHPLSGPFDLIKEGTEQLFLNAANLFTGIIAANAGTVVLGDTHALQNALVAINIDDGVDINGLDPTFGSLANSGNLNIGAQTLTTGSDNRTTFYFGILSGTGGSLIKNGTGTFTLEGLEPNTYSGLTTVNDGELHLNKGDDGGPSIVAGDASSLPTGGIDAIGGNLTINGGTVQLLHNEQIPDTATVTMNGGTFDFNDLTETVQTVTGSGGVIDLEGGTLITTNLDGTTPIQNIGVLTANQGTYGGVLSNAIGLGQLTKNGAGTLTLDGLEPNTHTGLTTVNDGELQLNKGTIHSPGCLIADAACAAAPGVNAIGGNLTINGGTVLLLADEQIPDSVIVTVNDNADLHLSGQDETIGTLNGTSLADFRLGASPNTATIHEGAFFGNIFGLGTIAKDTPATFTYGGTSSTGGQAIFHVHDGTLHLQDATLQNAFDSVHVFSGATLKGAFTTASSVTINDGATFKPGNSHGIVEIAGDLTLAPTATFAVEAQGTFLPSAGNTHDLVNVTGNVTLGGTLELTTLPDPSTFAADTDLATEFLIMNYGTRTPNAFFAAYTNTLIDTDFAIVPLLNETDKTLSLRATIPGDLNFDDKVSVADLSTFALNFGTTPGLYKEDSDDNSWELGDFNTDGAITVADLSLLALNFGFELFPDGTTTPPTPLSIHTLANIAGLDPSTVPEPTTAAILTIAGLAATTSRRRN